jgi:hypothetical protein
MIGQNYKPEERTGFLAEGDYLATIIKVEDSRSRAGNEMRIVEMSIKEEAKFTFKAYLVDDQYFNSKVTELFDAFKIQRGNFDSSAWINHQGYIHIRKSNPKDDGKQYWEFAWFVRTPAPRGAAPRPMQEGKDSPPVGKPAQGKAPAPAGAGGDDFTDDIPFNGRPIVCASDGAESLERDAKRMRL